MTGLSESELPVGRVGNYSGGMKIYTKTGDEGMTGLLGGGRVPKHAPRIAAYGDVDELNAVIGIARSLSPHDPIQKALFDVQNSLFTLGSQLASPKEGVSPEVITSAHVDALERQIDAVSAGLPPLKQFILPGGSPTAAYLHLARTVCRRAERQTVALSQMKGEMVDRWAIIYLNRLSDFLFVLARLANQLHDVEDVPWVSRR